MISIWSRHSRRAWCTAAILNDRGLTSAQDRPGTRLMVDRVIRNYLGYADVGITGIY